jgi:catalase (peroxidase I)
MIILYVIIRDFLEPVKAKYNLSYADTWTLAGAVAVEAMGGPKVCERIK